MNGHQLDSKEYYDHLAKEYRKVSRHRQEYLSGINLLLLELIKKRHVQSILDVGTGDGLRLESIRKQISPIISITAIEPSEKMFFAAKKNLGADVNLLECELCDIEETEKFHLIAALWNVIGHVDDLAAFFRKASSLIDEANGVFVFDANNIFNVKHYGLGNFLKNKLSALFGKKIYKFNLNAADTNGYVKLYHPKYIYKKLHMSGFNSVKVLYIDYATGRQTYKNSGQMFFLCER